MVGDVTPSYSQYFLIGFRRFTKITYVRSGELFPPSPPGAPPLVSLIYYAGSRQVLMMAVARSCVQRPSAAAQLTLTCIIGYHHKC